MKLIFAALASLALVAQASPAPLIDVEKTSVSFGQDKAALDRGEISVHLTRVDDLIDDANADRLLLERVSHVALQIQIVPEQGYLDVNGQQLSFFDQEPVEEHAVVSVVKAQTYSLPSDLPSQLWSPEGVQAMVESMSKGIVSVEIRLEKEDVPLEANLVGETEEGDLAIQSIEGFSLRRLALFLKIHEVEGVDLEHTSLVYAPILQLLVKSQDGQVADVTTISIADEPVVDDVAPGAGIADLAYLLPALEEEEDSAPEPIFRHHSQHHGGLWKWLTSLFAGEHHRKPFAGHPRYGLAAADKFDRDMLPAVRKGHAFAEHGRHRKMHGHHRHHRCFRRRFIRGISYVFGTLAAFFTTTATGSLMAGFLVGGLLFKLIRIFKKASQRRRERKWAEAAAEFDDEKAATTVIFIEGEEGLPDYETASFSTEPLFDAAEEQEKLDEKRDDSQA